MTRRLWLGGALAALGVLAQGCADNEISLFIQQGQVPQSSGTTGCTVSLDPSGLHRNSGVLDLSLRRNFVMFPLYRSEVLAFQRRSTGRPETRGIFVDGANIELHMGSDVGPAPSQIPANLAQYQIVSTTFIPPASAEGPGYGVGDLEIIPSPVADALAAQLCQPIMTDVTATCPVPQWPNQSLQVIAVIRPFGHTNGGIQVSGSHFVFPITFCCHCLVQFQSAADNPAVAGPDCSSVLGQATQACNTGQDDPVDCRTCSSNPLLCQPRGFQLGTAACPIP